MKNEISLEKFTLLIFTIGLFISCKDEVNKESMYDPAKPIEITGFDPKEGPARTRLYIHGSNFGTDANKINLKIGGIPTKVIGTNGSEIYCMVPFSAKEGTIEVNVGDTLNCAVASEKFNYISKSLVTTLSGKVDNRDRPIVKDGSFEEAGFASPTWIQTDPKNPDKLYITDGSSTGGYNIREMDFKNRQVSTLLTRSEGNMQLIRSINFTAGGDTMLIANQAISPHSIGACFTTRANGFKNPRPLFYARNVSCVFQHPNGEIYYSSRYTNQVHRYDLKTKQTTNLFKIGTQDAVVYMFLHPSGNFAYLLCANWRVILKSEYDWENKTFKNYNIFTGKQGQTDCVDGQGTNVRHTNPLHGCFVKNDQYVKEGKKDVYDFYFCEANADCIRCLTPEGFVSIYAGRGSKGADNKTHGYIDGDLLKEARFYYPSGIHYDVQRHAFYIADTKNFRIREIKKDE